MGSGWQSWNVLSVIFRTSVLQIIASGIMTANDEVFTNTASVVSDKPIDVELVKNAVYQQWRVFG